MEQTPKGTDSWLPLETDPQEREKIFGESVSFARDVWYRFSRKFTALLGFFLLVALAVFCILGPVFSKASYDSQNLDFVNMPPTFSAYEFGGRFLYMTPSLKIIEVSSNGELLSPLKKLKDDGMKKRTYFELSSGSELSKGDELSSGEELPEGGEKLPGEQIVLNYKVRPARLEDSNGNALSGARTLMNKTYPLGTDSLGRDMLVRLMMGMRISMLIAFVATVVNLVIGILYGGVSAYAGGMADIVMMRVVEVINTIPLTLYVILLQVIMENSDGITSIVLALGTVYWVNMARVVRGGILALREQEFVYAARTAGAGGWRILTTHLIPNAMGPIIVTATMLIPNAIFIEAFMSFIGLGVKPPMASLGTMCNDALANLRAAPYQLFLPALAICLIMFAFNFVGDGLRDALDPKLRR